MLKRIAILAVVAIGLAAGPAAAQQYPPDTNLITVSDTTPCPGGKATVTAETFTPGSTVTVSLDSSAVAEVTADDNGKISLEVTVPASTTIGEHVISASGTGSDESPLSLNADIDVVSCDAAPTPTTAAPGASLPRTGSDSTGNLLRIGFALFALGGVFLAVAAKRRRRAAALA